MSQKTEQRRTKIMYVLKIVLLLAFAVKPSTAFFCSAGNYWQICQAPNIVQGDYNIKRMRYMINIQDTEPGNKYVCCFAYCCYDDSGCGIHWPFFYPVCGVSRLAITYCNAWEKDYKPSIMCFSNWNRPPALSWDYGIDKYN